MSLVEGRIYRPADANTSQLRQGEILCHLRQLRLNLAEFAKGNDVVDFVTHPYAIVISQDCDLESDYRARYIKPLASALLPSVLFCQLETAVQLRGREDINKSIWDRVKINKDERYHFFEVAESAMDRFEQGVPELGADFKRYFTISTDEVYYQLATNNIARRNVLLSPYLEHFSHRFTQFQARIALPEDHYSEPATPVQGKAAKD